MSTKKKTPTPAEQLTELTHELVREFNWWKSTNELGCNDPFWPDGTNMNLIRNHVLHFKGEIRKLCEETGLNLPEEYYIPTPPEVQNNYMAPGSMDTEDEHQKARRKRLREMGDILATAQTDYDDSQTKLW